MNFKILIPAFLFAFAINSIFLYGQTTIEEYNYVTKGYSIQVESGLDMKKGYIFEDVSTESTTERTAELKVLYRLTETSKKTIAAYLIIYKRKGMKTEYICIPHPNSDSEISNKYWMQLYDGNNDSSQRLQLISYLISQKMKW